MILLATVIGCIIAGGIIGFTGGMLGIGGGLLAIPLLAIVLNMGQQMAQGTALIMVLPAVLLTLYKYNQHSRLNFAAAVIGGSSSFMSTWAGARLALNLPSSTLRVIYAGFVLLMALFYFHQFYQRSRGIPRSTNYRSANDPSVSRLWFVLLGVMAGFTGGIFGVGGAVIIVPLLTLLFRYSQTTAQGIALSMVVPSTTVALIAYSAHGQVAWSIGIPLALGGLYMVPKGVSLAYKLPEPKLKLVFACTLVVIMFLLLIKV